MVWNIISVIANILYFVILNIEMFTDRATLPDGIEREWNRSPIGRLDAADNLLPLYLFLFFGVVSIVSNVLLMFGLKHNIVKIIRLISTIASTLMFIVIMIYAGTIHPKY